MTARLDVEKAIQALGVVLRSEGKRASRLRLLKLLYIADREAIESTGYPILGSRLVAMKHGPLHSELLDLINGTHPGEPLWSKYFRNSGRDILLDAEPDTGKLSGFEMSLLVKVTELRLEKQDYDIADETHGFDEWVKTYPGGDTSAPIPIELLIHAVGRDADRESILQDMTDSTAFDHFFAGICSK